MPSVSVIVPVYKVEAFLLRCIDSLRAQRFTDFECILVDDGSPDECGSICDKIAAEDCRFSVIHKANGGLSSARNAGLNAANGEYIVFVDSDDYVLPNYLESLHNICIQKGCDIAICGVEDVSEDGKSFSPSVSTLPAREGLFDADGLLGEFYKPNSTYYTVAWNKMYRAKLWKDLRYPEGMNYEDDAVAHILYCNADKVYCSGRTLYKYCLREGSIIRTELTASAFDSVTAMHMRYLYFVKNGISQAITQKTFILCWDRYLELCAKAKNCKDPDVLVRWHEEQNRMKGLAAALTACRGITTKKRLSCAYWAFHPLPKA